MSDGPAFADALQTWNRRFGAEGYLFGTEPNAWLAAHAELLLPGQRVLCVADGEGRNSVFLARRGCEVDAFDLSPVAVEKAKRLAGESGARVNYAVADCDGFAWQAGRYDCVVAVFVQFADPAMRSRLFANMVRCLKPGGLVALHGYTPKQLEYRTGGPPFVSHLYTPEMLRESFAALEVLELRDYEAQIAEGEGHRGRSALIGMVARLP